MKNNKDMNECALLVATLTHDGKLLSNLHFGICYIGSEEDVWNEFYQRAGDLVNVDLFDSVSAPFARGINENGFTEVYRIQHID